MFLQRDYCSARHGHAGVLLAAVTFALGLGIGAIIGPVTAIAATATRRDPSARSAATMRMVHPAEVIRVIDGDTFEARVASGPGSISPRACGCAASTRPNSRRTATRSASRPKPRAMRWPRMLVKAGSAYRTVGLDKYGGRVVADASTRKHAGRVGGAARRRRGAPLSRRPPRRLVRPSQLTAAECFSARSRPPACRR